jgi:hypothetical protein
MSLKLLSPVSFRKLWSRENRKDIGIITTTTAEKQQ